MTDVAALLERICTTLLEAPVPCACDSVDKCGQASLLSIRGAATDLQTGALPDGLPTRLDALITRAVSAFKTFPHKKVPVCWRSVHTDASILRSACDLLRSDDVHWEKTVGRLDGAIIISGAAGYGRLDIMYDFIELVQTLHLPLIDDPFEHDTPSSSSSAQIPAHCLQIPRLSAPPSLGAFTRALFAEPFILPSFCSDWPALNEHSWASRSYLLRVAGRGRVVPVELGADYTRDDWGQELMPWLDFLHTLSTESTGVRYLAQYDLLKQFPALSADIIVPDYVYADIPHARTDVQTPVLNAWLGCRGAGSPAHVDAFSNCYCLVTGRRVVWLAPPDADLDADGNTARCDVFGANPEPTSVSGALAAVLEPGDMLYIPRGWWHAFRVEETSFAVSMWF
ncbi:Clavaminate synthase-like protein [Exidia glandulosa HHB12029]|uniref:Clavaminate synthase-like protein n=1 Tax=Exidia glandulosa HHB12029 TaxID=1314781 RepID=A0A165PMU2_EXIGL|nr:Clavaminate synthase-like protein [Exidia glandulosa HHB12029]